MSHFAQVINGIVEQVIVAEQDFIDTLPDKDNWIQTSYNTIGCVHYGPNGMPDDGIPLRANYASIGGHYDAEKDVFYNRQLFKSWVLDTNTWIWNPPIPRPDNGKIYTWNEEVLDWDEVK